MTILLVLKMTGEGVRLGMGRGGLENPGGGTMRGIERVGRQTGEWNFNNMAIDGIGTDWMMRPS